MRSFYVAALSVIAGLPLLLIGAAATTAGAASPAPITIAYITDLTGEGASENANVAGGVRGSARDAKCRRRSERPQAHSPRH